ncbi:uncharacterized protein [Linepithema humile]|uniref:uncharacterized protein n=1 Tax=Linepithema humile TaxID=83485 RepID=UPI00351E6D8C
MSPNIITNKNVWEYYTKVSDFKAKCKYCKYTYLYKDSSNFKTHIKKHKEISEDEEEKKLIRWKYFKYLNQYSSQCVICNTDVPSTTESVEHHLSLHSEEQKNYYVYGTDWTLRFRTEKNDKIVECNICHKNISLCISKSLDYHIKKKHLDKLKNTQEAYDTVGSSERVSSLQTDTMSPRIITNKNVWEYYTKVSDFKAKCKYCENTYFYKDSSNFKTHIKIHKEISEDEEKNKLIRWKYFKYLNQYSSQCVICNTDVPSTTESVEHHLSLHSEEQKNYYVYGTDWTLRFRTEKNDKIEECNICHKNISLSISKSLDYHTKNKHLDKLKNTQEAYNTVGSSERVSSLQTDTMSLSIITNKNVWKYYTKVSDFKAKCKSCRNTYLYKDSSSFKRHIKIHKEISEDEEEKKLIRWKYFKYLNQYSSQCVICNTDVPSTTESVEHHLRLHSEEQQKNNIYGTDWTLRFRTEKNDNIVECNICHKDVSLSILKSLDCHTRNKHLDKLKNTQEAYDTVGSSERVSSLQTDTMSE